MPELPSVTVYCERLAAFCGGAVLDQVRLASPFLLRTVDPPLKSVHRKTLRTVERLGKRIVLGFDGDLFLVIHLMIAGRLRWRKNGVALPKRGGLAAFDFPHGSVLFTEVSKKKRASLHVVSGRAGLADFDRGGLEVLDASEAEFIAAMTGKNHTLKRALTDPKILSGVGNAYSDEILHRARLSPFKQTQSLGESEFHDLFSATIDILTEWTERLRTEVGDGFPEKVTAFHDEMAVHGKYQKPCPVCGKPVQRIRYAENEANYCAKCQTEGRLLSDRSLSRLLKNNWPKTIEELETKGD